MHGQPGSPHQRCMQGHTRGRAIQSWRTRYGHRRGGRTHSDNMLSLAQPLSRGCHHCSTTGHTSSGADRSPVPWTHTRRPAFERSTAHSQAAAMATVAPMAMMMMQSGKLQHRHRKSEHHRHPQYSWVVRRLASPLSRTRLRSPCDGNCLLTSLIRSPPTRRCPRDAMVELCRACRCAVPDHEATLLVVVCLTKIRNC